MTAVWGVALVSHLVALLVGVGVGARLRGRRRYNAGVAYGRAYERRWLGLPVDPSLIPRQRSRFSLRSDRKPGRDPLVTKAEMRPSNRPGFYV